jgi:hypothetical protein
MKWVCQFQYRMRMKNSDDMQPDIFRHTAVYCSTVITLTVCSLILTLALCQSGA